MKLEEGIYVRTEEGKIFKTDGDKLYLSNDKKIFYRLLTRIPHESVSYKVIKTSNNIIDLIEVGDYVNGEKVWEVIRKDMYHFGNGIILKDEKDQDIYSNFRYSKFEDIKSIVTKEQFESMQYKVD
jgi:hypothetical protein